ncbi:MAG: mannitol dehydrogenase family protein, partial [Gammaproteobacteria bacterium]|nr:mannitol dehydrogenase family protein [Gammaproteobacteria bacterium]
MTQPIRITSRYAPRDVGIGIVHIGLGAFHRAHQACYIEAVLNRHNGGDWGICAANIRSNRMIVEQLEAQAYRYHVVDFAGRDSARVTEVQSIRRALFAGNDAGALLDQMTCAETRIVTLTVTEKGYYLSPASGQLLTDAPAIAADIATPESPYTAPGIVLEALRRRRDAGFAPFTVLCCDNMPNNGAR